jgi:DNA-binding transcriptional ArsR family regulator
MPTTRRRVTEAAALKALAHPTRMNLLSALVTEGPLTASQAAELVGESPSNCSWHLRRLAEHGFVEEAPSEDGRNRPWRAVSQGLEWGEDADSGQAGQPAQVAADALTDVLLDREVQRLRAARTNQPNEPAEWRDGTGLMQSQVWLTADEARETKRQLEQLMTAYIDRGQDPGLRPPDARLVSMVGWLVPSGPARHADESSEERR